MNNFNLSEFVKLTSWISLVAILWMWVLGIAPLNFPSWFAFLFFFCTLLLVTAYVARKN